ncbi:winged helix DNA-binding protein [Erythrobacter sp. F6033]|uniref:winged helix DNA-binding protein n=1 Tax=Erythrobacter sp. F6033 TaxID=2926401 RepID=UPI001FF66127|nr:winged helix DNA-binding protein [Erythrobacter sp. F6033]MCK0128452.1 winged helix DNA-binding protein [Erythrobacter sp. F6033]
MGNPTFNSDVRSTGTLELASSGEVDLQYLAEQLTAIANRLRGEVVGSPHGLRQTTPTLVEPQTGSSRSDEQSARAEYVEMARNLYTTRRKRESIFGNTELFGEPAWDILLDLYVAHAENKKVSVSSACIGSASPSTTGLRWLGILAEQGLITREHDPEDQRRVLVRLSDAGLEAMDNYFASIDAGAYSAPKHPRPA